MKSNFEMRRIYSRSAPEQKDSPLRSEQDRLDIRVSERLRESLREFGDHEVIEGILLFRAAENDASDALNGGVFDAAEFHGRLG